jgi:hypothetical protein
MTAPARKPKRFGLIRQTKLSRTPITEFRTKWTTFTGFHPDTGQYQRDAQLHLENPTHRLKYLEGVDYAIENRAQTFDTLLKSTRIDKEYRRTLEEQAKANELDKKFVELVKDT